MTTTRTITIFKFSELSEKAKETARQWYREGAFDFEWWDFVYEDAITCAAILGIEIEAKNIQFSGFWSQGDGASFTGKYAYAKDAHNLIRQHAPQDETLARIADGLLEAQRKANYKLVSKISIHRGGYCHSHMMDFDTYVALANGDESAASDEQELAIKTAMRGFADWLYRQLEKEYDWRNADEQVDESIEANEYEFLENGARA